MSEMTSDGLTICPHGSSDARGCDSCEVVRLRDALEQIADYTDADDELYGFVWRECRRALLGIESDDNAEIERAWEKR